MKDLIVGIITNNIIVAILTAAITALLSYVLYGFKLRQEQKEFSKCYWKRKGRSTNRTKVVASQSRSL